jgi:hypothetical protein
MVLDQNKRRYLFSAAQSLLKASAQCFGIRKLERDNIDPSASSYNGIPREREAGMWTDSKPDVDYLNFAGLTETVAELINQAKARPIAGAWGAGRRRIRP